jgi:hypothetical protein
MLYIIIIHVHNYLLLQVCIIRYLGDILYRWNLSTSRFKAGVTQHLHMHHPRFPVVDEPNFGTPIYKISMRIVGEQQPMKHIPSF